MITTTNATPIRITAEHYQIESQSADRAGKVYDLFFNHEIRRWQCSCPDANPAKGNNPNCKHVRCLRAFIKAQMEGSPVQVQASEIVFKAPLAAAPLDPIREQLAGMQLALAEQAEMIRDLQAEVTRLQACKAEKRIARAKKPVEQVQVQSQEVVAPAATSQSAEEAAEEAARLAAAEEAAAEFYARLGQLGKDEAGEVEPAGNVPALDLEEQLQAWAAKEAKRTSAPLNRGNRGFSMLRK